LGGRHDEVSVGGDEQGRGRAIEDRAGTQHRAGAGSGHVGGEGPEDVVRAGSPVGVLDDPRAGVGAGLEHGDRGIRVGGVEDGQDPLLEGRRDDLQATVSSHALPPDDARTKVRLGALPTERQHSSR